MHTDASYQLWQWYDNNDSQYKTIDPGPGVIEELEVSFLCNVKQNFDPVEFGQRFNNCLLPNLTTNLEYNLGFKDKSYAFRCTFSPSNAQEKDWCNIILNMEQLAFDMRDVSVFPRNIKRVVDGRNSLEFLYRNSDKFATV